MIDSLSSPTCYDYDRYGVERHRSYHSATCMRQRWPLPRRPGASAPASADRAAVGIFLELASSWLRVGFELASSFQRGNPWEHEIFEPTASGQLPEELVEYQMTARNAHTVQMSFRNLESCVRLFRLMLAHAAHLLKEARRSPANPHNSWTFQIIPRILTMAPPPLPLLPPFHSSTLPTPTPTSRLFPASRRVPNRSKI